MNALQKSAIAVLAEQIRQLDAAVGKLEVADKQYRKLAALDHAHYGNGHLHKREDPQ